MVTERKKEKEKKCIENKGKRVEKKEKSWSIMKKMSKEEISINEMG